MSIEELFEQWLIKYKAYNKFVYCLLMDGTYELDDLYNERSAADWIDEAFYWETTPQGHGYWSNLNFEWREYVKTLQ